MTDKKRRWFQIHLSTAVVLMFVAGGLMWANVAEKIECKTGHSWMPDEGITSQMNPIQYDEHKWGWPSIICLRRSGAFVSALRHYGTRPVIIDVLVAFAILAAVAFVCEWLIRRREARKP